MINLPFFRNILGSFSDGAVLFPLLALLTMNAGFSSSTLLLTTGVAYLVSSIVFRVPMAVQPLKSIAVAAITIGATFQEVRLSGLLLGVFCLVLYFFKIDRFAKHVPANLIHQLQVGLGVLLVFQGIKAVGDWTYLVSSVTGICVLLGSVFMVFFPEIFGIPILGLIATAGLIIAVFSGDNSSQIVPMSSSFELVRPGLIIGLVAPQIALTLGNSVLATQDVCSRYFGVEARLVTSRRLLASIGIGNICASLVGGMPFCHGSGGVTAHVRGGATRAWSTALMGIVLIILGLHQFFSHATVLMYSPVFVSILLMATGVFHLKLAAPTAGTSIGLVKLGFASFITIVTRNLIWVLGAAILFEAMGMMLRHIVPEKFSNKNQTTEVKL